MARELETMRDTGPSRLLDADFINPTLLDAATFQRLIALTRAAERLWCDVWMRPAALNPSHKAHAVRVALLSMKILEAMGLGADQARRTVWAAFLHDIGNLAVPGPIILKPGRLTKAERAAMEVHPIVGGELLNAFSDTRDLARIVLSHHERHDGGGYPGGLPGRRIPMEARILAVADALDAMTSQRPYREPMPRSVALNELVREAGRQFDPRVVEAADRAIEFCKGPFY
jgi:HD-GYP domain-containing protein (c-di-GMP phosphodiesterase class II)